MFVEDTTSISTFPLLVPHKSSDSMTLAISLRINAEPVAHDPVPPVRQTPVFQARKADLLNALLMVG
jgi:hypothetical protein